MQTGGWGRSIAAWTVAVIGMLGLASCGSDDPVDVAETGVAPAADEEAITETLPPPEGLPAFYGAPDPIPDDEPGTLVRTEAIDAPDVNGTLHRVMYTSESLQGDPIVVTGVVAIPEDDAPDGGHPVIAWAHGTTGIADECTPSLEGPASVPLLNDLLDQGYAVAATDYEGLGTPGRHPYIVGESEARGVIDSVRAASQIEGVELSDRYLVWGHSQGGHAAMYALSIAAEWAPELELVGVVAGAPPSQFELIYTVLQTSPFRHYLLMAAAGFNAAYGDDGAPLDQVLTPAGVEAVDLVDEGCSGDLQAATAGFSSAELTAADPATVPTWAELLEENDPGQFTEPVDTPLLVIHGGNDEQVPVAASALMFDQLCAIGQNQTRWVYPGQSHAGVVGASVGDMTAWIDNRFAEEPSTAPVQPTGQPDVHVQQCQEDA